jgi:AcrR family transcriptional regulator
MASNRGPAAASENRAALLSSARALFAEEGAQVPLARIAEHAGVGKASLYRQFGDRAGLILAVFADNVDELERAAADPGATASMIAERVARQLVESVGFLSVVAPAANPSNPGLVGPGGRVADLFDALLADGRHGDYRADLTTRELIVAIHMFGALLYTTPEGDRQKTAKTGWALVRRALQKQPPSPTPPGDCSDPHPRARRDTVGRHPDPQPTTGST